MRDAAKYTHGKNQSLAESFNHEITNLVPKAQPVASMYTPRVHLAILNHNLGWEKALPLLFKRLRLPQSQHLSKWLTQKSLRKLYDAERFQRVGKAKRAVMKVAKKYTKTSHTYKELVICSCKGSCKNGKCKCRANRDYCDPKRCKCGALCTNRVDEKLLPPGEQLETSLARFDHVVLNEECSKPPIQHQVKSSTVKELKDKRKRSRHQGQQGHPASPVVRCQDPFCPMSVENNKD